MEPHILIVDDDPFIAKMIDFLLVDAGYDTTTLADPRRVLPFLADHAVDLVLLDVMMPHIDGFALGALLRRQFPDLPIIFLTARGQPGDKVEGFGHGADDYLAKPFEPTELLVRIQAVLRRYRRAERNRFGTVIRVGEATLDLGELQFAAPGRSPVLLTPTEMKILECLMRNANTVISRETLIERTWGYDYEGESNRVDVYIRRLRRKVEADAEKPLFIRTVRGMGYIFREGRYGEGEPCAATA
jgi:two-component system, OmpR family, response regulator RegX3